MTTVSKARVCEIEVMVHVLGGFDPEVVFGHLKLVNSLALTLRHVQFVLLGNRTLHKSFTL